MRKTLLMLFISFTLLSCATYKPKTGDTGYTDTTLGSNKYQVSGSDIGNGAEESAKNIALVRSAELTLEAGYQYFLILQTDSEIGGIPGLRGDGTVVTIPTATFNVTIEFTDDPEGLDANEIISTLGPTVGYKE